MKQIKMSAKPKRLCKPLKCLLPASQRRCGGRPARVPCVVLVFVVRARACVCFVALGVRPAGFAMGDGSHIRTCITKGRPSINRDDP